MKRVKKENVELVLHIHIQMTSIIFHAEFIANASEFCSGDGGVGFTIGHGTWREKKFDVTSDSEGDDGYSKSDESNSHHSAHETLTTKSGNSTSSGVSSNRQWQNGSGSSKSSSSSRAGHNHEIVNKLVISREINDTIFKPGYFKTLFSLTKSKGANKIHR